MKLRKSFPFLSSSSSSSSSFSLVRQAFLLGFLTTLAISFLLLFLAVNSVAAAAGDEEPSPGESVEADDFYGILELLEQKEDATERDVKTKWRYLSKKYHPDLKGEKTREHYQKIQRAYEVIGDRKKRKLYDMRGIEGVQQFEKNAAQGGGGQGNMQDPFCAFFGNCGGGGGGGGGGDRGKNIEMVMLVTLEDIYNGASHTVKLNKQRLCKHCKGSGADSKDDYKKCSNCGGSGQVTQRVQLMPGFVQQMQQPCPHCGGKGKEVKKKCHVCRGHKVARADQMLSVEIEQGTPENHELVFELEADQSPEQLPGDVKFTVQSAPHKVFERKGNDLHVTLRLSLGEALLGFRREIKHLDGHTVTVEEKNPIQYGQLRTISEEGMPVHNVPSERGKLVIRYEIEFPDPLFPDQKQALAEIL